MEQYEITLTFLEPLLGAVPMDKKVYATYIASKGTDNGDEVESIEEREEKGWTGFHKADGLPILYDYVIKGFFKDAASMLRRDKGSLSSKLAAFKKIIDGLTFITPRQIALALPTGAQLGVLERPLRAQTAQGERVALARSDTAPAGTVLEFTVSVLGHDVTEAVLREWFDYGALRGLGQWRNAGYGRFAYTLKKS